MSFLSSSHADAAKAHETALLETLFASARRLQMASEAKSPIAPRFLLEAARSMARHMGMPDPRMKACLPSMAFWQIFLPSALAGDTSWFTEPGLHMPWSFESVRDGVAEVETWPQVVFAGFHMVAFPLIAAMLGAACKGLHNGPHVLVARRNMGWLRIESGRWAFEAGEVISTDPAGLRRLIAGLRSGEIQRLVILVDGPHPPASRGTRALSNVSPTLGFKTGLLTRILSMGIPVRPLTHFWESNHLQVKWHALLDPARDRGGIDAAEHGIATLASLFEDLLRRHPEQWLNWAAASLRT
jgi:hypothetical protein